MRNQTLFREDVILANALEIWNRMLAQHTGAAMSGIHRSALHNIISSGDWVLKFMNRKNLARRCPLRNNCILPAETIHDRRQDLM